MGMTSRNSENWEDFMSIFCATSKLNKPEMRVLSKQS